MESRKKPRKYRYLQCQECKKTCRDTYNLKRHMRHHTQEKFYKCEICDRGFGDQSNLRNHMRSHTGEKPHLCDVCFNSFSQPQHLRDHMLVHTGEKSFICCVCDKAFNRSCNLIRHMRLHTGGKPYKCEICCERFADASSLKAHSTFHTENSDNAKKSIKVGEFKFASVGETYLQNEGSTYSFLSEENENRTSAIKMGNEIGVSRSSISNMIDELTPLQRHICYICLKSKSDLGIEFLDLITQLRKSHVFESQDYLIETIIRMTQSSSASNDSNLLIPNRQLESNQSFSDGISDFQDLSVQLNPLACSILEKIKAEREMDFDKFEN